MTSRGTGSRNDRPWFASPRRLVFVDYFATWCAPCRQMDATVFRDPEVQRRMSDFVLLPIDVDKNMVGRTHRISVLPSYVVGARAFSDFRCASPSDFFCGSRGDSPFSSHVRPGSRAA